MSDKPTRPYLHFAPSSGWINDPLGLTWNDGVYHLFFQYVPGRTTWAPQCHWGHATSRDLWGWAEHDPILEPGDGDDGVWSGSLVIDPEGGPRIFYTSVSVPDFGIGQIRQAHPDDATWMTWSKGATVVETDRRDLIAFRDPFVFKDGDKWRMFVGTAAQDGTAAASSWSSRDLRTWEYDGPAASRHTSLTEPVWTGSLWECPQLIEIGSKHALVTSVWDADTLHYVAYGIGRYAGGRFSPSSWHRLTFGDGYYAPSFFTDSKGNPCLIFWIRGVVDESENRSGALSIPHQLSLVDGKLVLQPHGSIPWDDEFRVRDGGIWAQGDGWEDGTGRRRLEPTSAWRLTWQRPQDPGQVATLSISDSENDLTFESRSDSLEITIDGQLTTVPCDTGRIEIVIDGRIVEVFAGSSVAAITARTPIVGSLACSENSTVTAASYTPESEQS